MIVLANKLIYSSGCVYFNLVDDQASLANITKSVVDGVHEEMSGEHIEIFDIQSVYGKVLVSYIDKRANNILSAYTSRNNLDICFATTAATTGITNHIATITIPDKKIRDVLYSGAKKLNRVSGFHTAVLNNRVRIAYPLSASALDSAFKIIKSGRDKLTLVLDPETAGDAPTTIDKTFVEKIYVKDCNIYLGFTADIIEMLSTLARTTRGTRTLEIKHGNESFLKLQLTYRQIQEIASQKEINLKKCETQDEARKIVKTLNMNLHSYKLDDSYIVVQCNSFLYYLLHAINAIALVIFLAFEKKRAVRGAYRAASFILTSYIAHEPNYMVYSYLFVTVGLLHSILSDLLIKHRNFVYRSCILCLWFILNNINLGINFNIATRIVLTFLAYDFVAFNTWQFISR